MLSFLPVFFIWLVIWEFSDDNNKIRGGITYGAGTRFFSNN